MHAKGLATIMMAVLIGTLTTSCQKKPVEQAFQKALEQTLKKVFGQTLHTPETNHVQIPLNRTLDKKDLGMLHLSNHISATVSLGSNKDCTITPTLLEDENVQIILTVQTKGPDGKLEGVSVARVLTRSGEPFDVFIGDMDLAFTPKLATR